MFSNEKWVNWPKRNISLFSKDENVVLLKEQMNIEKQIINYSKYWEKDSRLYNFIAFFSISLKIHAQFRLKIWKIC